jgi:hypothetical protein
MKGNRLLKLFVKIRLKNAQRLASAVIEKKI